MMTEEQFRSAASAAPTADGAVAGADSAGPPAAAAQYRSLAANLGVNVAAPLLVFYGLRAAGVGQWWALLAGAVPPLLRAVAMAVRTRRIDSLGAFTLLLLALGAATSLLTGSARFLLAKDGAMTGAAGLCILATLLMRRPFIASVLMSVTAEERRAGLAANWRDSPMFRHVMRVLTVVWGVGLIADAVVRIVLAYALPVDAVPLISNLQYVVAFLLLEGLSRVYGRRRSVIERIKADMAADA
ncbi:VC0807 family protein [Streptomyces olivoreticuli]